MKVRVFVIKPPASKDPVYVYSLNKYHWLGATEMRDVSGGVGSVWFAWRHMTDVVLNVFSSNSTPDTQNIGHRATS